MPWKSDGVRDQRWRLLKLWGAGKSAVSELSRRFGISRKTAYKWKARFELEGRRGLKDRRRKSQRVHNRPAARWLRRIRQVRRRHPSWGPKKLRCVLQTKYGRRGVPSIAAIGRWLRAWSMSQRKPRRGARRGPRIERPHLTVAVRANEVWSVDFKGWFRTGDGSRVDPLTVRDMATSYLLAVELVCSQSVEHTQRAFRRIFQTHGLPEAIRVDNGCPFGADGALGLTRLSAWWIRLGIRVEFITPGCPGENAAHEQMHGIYKAEVASPPAPTIQGQRQRSRKWMQEYNELRPHEAQGMRRPAELYRKSKHRMPAKLPPLRYPPDWLTRLVKGKGMIHLHGQKRFVGEAFERERIGLKRTLSGWDVYFGTMLIGTLSASDRGGIHAVRYQRPR